MAYRRYQNDYQILQVNDPEKDVLEDTLKQKYPTILTDVVIRWKGIRDLTPETVQNKNLNTNSEFRKLVNTYLNFYNLPLTIYRDYNLKSYNASETDYIVRQTNFRYWNVQIYGTARFILFSPKESKFLYPAKDNKTSKINFWKLDYWDKNSLEEPKNKYLDQFPKFNKVKYIEIIVHPGNMLYIPYGWWYTSISQDENVRLLAWSKSVFSW